jgi:hypothetical protein
MDDAFEHWLTESENPWNEFLSHVDRHQVNCARVDCLWWISLLSPAKRNQVVDLLRK